MADTPNNPTPAGPGRASKPSLITRLLKRVGIDIRVETASKTVTHVHEEKFWRASIRPRFLSFVLLSLGAALVLLASATWYSTKPSFCNSCHIMHPYYNAWKTSNHNFVACVQCHYPPGDPGDLVWHKFQALSQVVKYFTRTYSSKPFAEIDDASCLRSGCHSTRLLQGQVVNKEKGIFFDHTPHLTAPRYGQQLRCVSCHSQIVIGTHMEVTWDTCYLCHLMGKKGEQNGKPMGGCLGCHLLPDKEIKTGSLTFVHKDFATPGNDNCQNCHRSYKEGEGAVSQYRCFTCHNQPEKLQRFKETDFLHDNHVTKHHIACLRCHEEIHHGQVLPRPATELVSECARCHSSLHDRETDLYRGQGAKGIPDMPSPMYQAGVDCVACHLQKTADHGHGGEAASMKGSEKGCNNCHGPIYPSMVSEAEQLVKDTAARLQQKLVLVQGALDSATVPPDEKITIYAKLGEARDNLELVNQTHTPHNIYYLAGALTYSESVLSATAKRLNVTKAEPTASLPLISGAYCTTLCHNKLGVQVPPETAPFNGISFPHKPHLSEGLSCRVCHDFGAHRDVKIKSPDVCEKCHSAEDLQGMKAKK